MTVSVADRQRVHIEEMELSRDYVKDRGGRV